MTTLLITIVPSFLILLYFFFSDKFKEPKSTVAIVFVLGILICLPAGILNNFMFENFGGQDNGKDLTHSFLGPAWTEEILKFLVLYAIVLRRSEFNEPMDGIVYGVVVSLGFATYENYDYVFRLAETWDIAPQQLAIWRSYSAVPMHGLNGCIMGFNFGIYAFTANKKFLVLSLLIPFLLHGFYNFLGHPFHYIVVVGMLIYAIKLHNNLKKLQLKKKNENESLKV
ncbi:PrsW family glutamic-type intramembrane protease [Pelagibacteraceae bacterium]|nr:PrsW family glutamic-type intramembrane protease [Pelagibacteraceae bacterium]